MFLGLKFYEYSKKNPGHFSPLKTIPGYSKISNINLDSLLQKEFHLSKQMGFIMYNFDTSKQ